MRRSDGDSKKEDIRSRDVSDENPFNPENTFPLVRSPYCRTLRLVHPDRGQHTVLNGSRRTYKVCRDGLDLRCEHLCHSAEMTRTIDREKQVDRTLVVEFAERCIEPFITQDCRRPNLMLE